METQLFSAADAQVCYFNQFIGRLVQKYQPVQIFCFSRKGILEQNRGAFTTEHTDHECHYCLLLVTESSTRIDFEAQDYSNNHFRKGTVTLICHSQESVSQAIANNSRFFHAIYSSGELIYSKDGMAQMQVPGRYIPGQAAAKANQHFNRRMPLAKAFFGAAEECLANFDFTICVFQLHQAVEQCCILLIRVILGYRCEMHNLKRLLRLCASFSDEPIRLFLPGNGDDETLFGLLLRSYSSARYHTGFSVNQADAEALYQRVSNMVSLTKELCEQKINELLAFERIPEPESMLLERESEVRYE